MRQAVNRGEIMNMAWKLARQGAEKFGGYSKLYFACALKIIWQETKRGKKAVVWHPQIGFQYLLDGIQMPRAKTRQGQLGLPGLAV